MNTSHSRPKSWHASASAEPHWPGAGLGGELAHALLLVVEGLRDRGVRLVRAGGRDALVLVVDVRRGIERALEAPRAVERGRPPQPVDLAHLVGDRDLGLGRDLLLDQRHREERRQVLGAERLLGRGVERRMRRPARSAHQVDPVGRDLGLGSRNLTSASGHPPRRSPGTNRFGNSARWQGRRQPRGSPRRAQVVRRPRHKTIAPPRVDARPGLAGSRRSSPRGLVRLNVGGAEGARTCAAIPVSRCTAAPRIRRSGGGTRRSPVARRRSTTSASGPCTRPAAPSAALAHLFRAEIDEAVVVALNDARDKLGDRALARGPRRRPGRALIADAAG